MLINLNTSIYTETWAHREIKGMHESYYCKREHKCYSCISFQMTYECYTCQEMADADFIHKSNYNLSVDDIMDIFEAKCPKQILRIGVVNIQVERNSK